MIDSDKCTKIGRPGDSGLARVLIALMVLLGTSIVWFACRFIVPRYEAQLMDAGLRPSPTVRVLLIASYHVARYFWWIAPILGLIFVFPRNPGPRETPGRE